MLAKKPTDVFEICSYKVTNDKIQAGRHFGLIKLAGT